MPLHADGSQIKTCQSQVSPSIMCFTGTKLRLSGSLTNILLTKPSCQPILFVFLVLSALCLLCCSSLLSWRTSSLPCLFLILLLPSFFQTFVYGQRINNFTFNNFEIPYLAYGVLSPFLYYWSVVDVSIFLTNFNYLVCFIVVDFITVVCFLSSEGL